jgi:hypothetical protein
MRSKLQLKASAQSSNSIFNTKTLLANDFCITSLHTRESRRLAGGLKT